MLAVLDKNDTKEKNLAVLLEDALSDGHCSICLEDWNDAQQFGRCGSFMLLQCGHVFHEHCLSGVADDLCPICRRPQQEPRALHELWAIK